MHLTSVVSAVAVLLGTTLANAASVNPKSLPPYQHLYSFSLEFTENHLFNSTLGTRVGLGLVG